MNVEVLSSPRPAAEQSTSSRVSDESTVLEILEESPSTPVGMSAKSYSASDPQAVISATAENKIIEIFVGVD
jgi:hypothetical protein